MRIDQATSPDRSLNPSTDRPATARGRSKGTSVAVLSLLMAATSWAVWSWVSPWLVLPYLILMALLLSPSPAGRPQGDRVEDGADASTGPATPSEPSASADGPSDNPDPSAAATVAPTRGKRGKGRSKKAKAPGEPPAEATWLQVAPGKFIRVEAPSPSAEAGPHEPFAGIPTEAEATPDPSSEPDQAEAAGTTEGPDSPDLAPDPESPVNRAEEDSTPLEGVGSDREERTSVEDSTSSTDLPDPADPTNSALAVVLTEEADEEEWEESRAGADPTETTVDETDFDDAGPSLDPFPSTLDAQSDLDLDPDAEDPEPAPLPGALPGPSRWPHQMAPRPWTRVGQPPRSVDRDSPPRRIARSTGAPRRSPRPRHLARLGLGRPRQITRSFPPRSPPGRRDGRG